MKENILIIGGAGYIGSHQVKMMCDQGYNVTVVDNLSTGFKDAVDSRANLIIGDIRDYSFLAGVFKENDFAGVIHFAALSLVGESNDKPLEYFDNNVYGIQVLLKVMVENDVKNLVFSSTAATYGNHEIMPITEEYATNPENPYGESKLIMEKMMKWCSKAYGINYIALRYFNACGASSDGTIGENHNPETHLIPIILQVALGLRENISIYGDDYDTEDGTCIRDYIHVEDLCSAHVCAIKTLFEKKESHIINLGYGHGYSVLEIIEATRRVTGHEIPEMVSERRLGDPAQLIAKNDKAREVLGWKPKYDDINLIIKTAYNYHKSQLNK